MADPLKRHISGINTEKLLKGVEGFSSEPAAPSTQRRSKPRVTAPAGATISPRGGRGVVEIAPKRKNK